MTWRLLLILAAFLPATFLSALDPHKQIGQYNHESWTSQRGLPGEAIYQILQTKDGYLWLRTGSGLVRFDGNHFEPMDARIGTEPVRAICMSADGDMLVRTTTRTVLYKDKAFSDYLPPARLYEGAIRVIFESREHIVFIGMDDLIYRLEKDGKPTKLRTHTGWINAFLEDHAGRVWIGGSPSIFLYRNNELSEALDKVASPNTVTALSEDPQRQIWVATGNGLYKLHPDALRLEPQQRHGPVLMSAILRDGQGNFWAGTEKSGITRMEPKGFSSLRSQDGLTDDSVLSLLEDREGSLWIGTASGLDQLRDTSLTTFTTREGLPTNRARSAIATSDGAVALFTESGGLVSIKNGTVTPFEHNKQLPSLVDSALFQSKDGSIWLGTLNGLSRIQNGHVTVYDGGGHFSKNFTSAISEDDEGLIVTNSESRAFRFKDGKALPFTLHGKPTPVTDSAIYTFTIYRDPAGTLWFGTTNGLLKLPSSDGSHGGWQLNTNFDVTSIFDDGQGSLWLGGRTPGLTQYRIRDGRVTHYTKQQGLFDGFASYTLGDQSGNLWISAEDGIYSASIKDLNDLADGKIKIVPSRKYGLADGMKTTEASDPATQPAGCRTPDGKLWFTTKKGIVAVDPAHLQHNNFIPPVLIEGVLANGVAQSLNEDLQIAPGVTSLDIYYTALSMRIPKRVHFKYQLEGYDREWVDAGLRRTAFYTKLPPGTYRFHVIADNDDGLWNNQGAFVRLVLEPRFYQTNAFYFACFLLAILVAVAINRISTRIIRARARELSRVVEERTAELRESQRELYLLAHFDILTGLPNRRMFTEEFGILCGRATGDEFALMLIDVDDFKSINDTFGHDAGDALLVEVSHRLQSAVRSTDKVARLGGDEFAVLLPGKNDKELLDRICTRVVNTVSSPVEFNGKRIKATVSVGIALYPEHGSTEGKLYKSADLALYEAKRLGRNTWHRSGKEMLKNEIAR